MGLAGNQMPQRDEIGGSQQFTNEGGIAAAREMLLPHRHHLLHAFALMKPEYILVQRRHPGDSPGEISAHATRPIDAVDECPELRVATAVMFI